MPASLGSLVTVCTHCVAWRECKNATEVGQVLCNRATSSHFDSMATTFSSRTVCLVEGCAGDSFSHLEGGRLGEVMQLLTSFSNTGHSQSEDLLAMCHS